MNPKKFINDIKRKAFRYLTGSFKNKIGKTIRNNDDLMAQVLNRCYSLNGMWPGGSGKDIPCIGTGIAQLYELLAVPSPVLIEIPEWGGSWAGLPKVPLSNTV